MSWLATLPASNFRVVFLAAIDTLTFGVVAWISIKEGSATGHPLMDSWMILLAALHGVQATKAITDRYSDYGYVERKGNADTAKAAATATDHPAVIVPPTTPPHVPGAD